MDGFESQKAFWDLFKWAKTDPQPIPQTEPVNHQLARTINSLNTTEKISFSERIIWFSLRTDYWGCTLLTYLLFD